MAEASLSYFKDFEPSSALLFSERVMQVVGFVIYEIPVGDVTTDDVTLIVVNAGPGSRTSASSGVEVRVDLDDEEWEVDDTGLHTPKSAKEKCFQAKQAIGNLLLGGVNDEPGAIVNVWVRQFMATGWYGPGYQGEEQRQDVITIMPSE